MKRSLALCSVIGALALSSAIAAPVKTPVRQEPKSPPPAANTSITETPLLRPGRGIGPFTLGQTPAELERMGVRHTPLDEAGWTSIAAEAGSDIVTYKLRFESGRLTIIDYRLSRSGLGLRIGSAVFKRDQPELDKALHKAMSCDPTDHREGGSHTRCATPPVEGATYLRGGIEYDCSAWISIGPPKRCTDHEVAKQFVEVRVSRD